MAKKARKLSYDRAIVAWQQQEVPKALNLPNRMLAVATCVATGTALIDSVKRNKSVREQAKLMRTFFHNFSLMAAQYPRRSVSLGIATNYPPGPCTRCGQKKCVCPPGQFVVARPTIDPAWLQESIHSVQVRMRKLYHGGNMLNGGRWNVLCRFSLEIHEALDNDMLDMAERVQDLVAGDNSRVIGDPDEGRLEEDLLDKSIEFGDVLLWLAVLANALDIPLASAADPESNLADLEFPDEVSLTQGEFEIAERT